MLISLAGEFSDDAAMSKLDEMEKISTSIRSHSKTMVAISLTFATSFAFEIAEVIDFNFPKYQSIGANLIFKAYGRAVLLFLILSSLYLYFVYHHISSTMKGKEIIGNVTRSEIIRNESIKFSIWELKREMFIQRIAILISITISIIVYLALIDVIPGAFL